MPEKVTASDQDLLAEIIRLPKNSDVDIADESLDKALLKVKLADLNIFSLKPGNKLNNMAEIAQCTRIPALFCADFDFENAFV